MAAVSLAMHFAQGVDCAGDGAVRQVQGFLQLSVRDLSLASDHQEDLRMVDRERRWAENGESSQSPLQLT